jgi:hypothetical protein
MGISGNRTAAPGLAETAQRASMPWAPKGSGYYGGGVAGTPQAAQAPAAQPGPMQPAPVQNPGQAPAVQPFAKSSLFTGTMRPVKRYVPSAYDPSIEASMRGFMEADGIQGMSPEQYYNSDQRSLLAGNEMFQANERNGGIFGPAEGSGGMAAPHTPWGGWGRNGPAEARRDAHRAERIAQSRANAAALKSQFGESQWRQMTPQEMQASFGYSGQGGAKIDQFGNISINTDGPGATLLSPEERAVQEALAAQFRAAREGGAYNPIVTPQGQAKYAAWQALNQGRYDDVPIGGNGLF